MAAYSQRGIPPISHLRYNPTQSPEQILGGSPYAAGGRLNSYQGGTDDLAADYGPGVSMYGSDVGGFTGARLDPVLLASAGSSAPSPRGPLSEPDTQTRAYPSSSRGTAGRAVTTSQADPAGTEVISPPIRLPRPDGSDANSVQSAHDDLTGLTKLQTGYQHIQDLMRSPQATLAPVSMKRAILGNLISAAGGISPIARAVTEPVSGLVTYGRNRDPNAGPVGAPNYMLHQRWQNELNNAVLQTKLGETELQRRGMLMYQQARLENAQERMAQQAVNQGNVDYEKQKAQAEKGEALPPRSMPVPDVVGYQGGAQPPSGPAPEDLSDQTIPSRSGEIRPPGEFLNQTVKASIPPNIAAVLPGPSASRREMVPPGAQIVAPRRVERRADGSVVRLPAEESEMAMVRPAQEMAGLKKEAQTKAALAAQAFNPQQRDQLNALNQQRWELGHKGQMMPDEFLLKEGMGPQDYARVDKSLGKAESETIGRGTLAERVRANTLREKSIGLALAHLGISQENLALARRRYERDTYGTDNGVPIPGMLTDPETGQPIGPRASAGIMAGTKGQAAQGASVVKTGQDLIDKINANRDIAGHLGSYLDMLALGTPFDDKRAHDLAASFSSFAALNPGLHGFRGHHAFDEFAKIIGSNPTDPDAAIAGIKSIMQTAQEVRQTHMPQVVHGGGKVAIPPRAGGAPVVHTKAEYDQLPKGAQYVDSADGQTYTKGK